MLSSILRTTLAVRPYLVPAVDLKSAKSYIRSGLSEDDMNHSACNVVTLGFIKLFKRLSVDQNPQMRDQLAQF